ncbi:MAG: hypothetical protein PHY93_19495 [Bacteriovorax sp.]|nr:hypothetical protein [Bacteriovorax sp.]
MINLKPFLSFTLGLLLASCSSNQNHDEKKSNDLLFGMFAKNKNYNSPTRDIANKNDGLRCKPETGGLLEGVDLVLHQIPTGFEVEFFMEGKKVGGFEECKGPQGTYACSEKESKDTMLFSLNFSNLEGTLQSMNDKVVGQRFICKGSVEKWHNPNL